MEKAEKQMEVRFGEVETKLIAVGNSQLALEKHLSLQQKDLMQVKHRVMEIEEDYKQLNKDVEQMEGVYAL